MANHVDSWMTILVPRANAAALKADIEGPARWHYPLAPLNGAGLPESKRKEISNHVRIDIDGNPDAYIEKFRALPGNEGRPAWMPVSLMDIEAMVLEQGGPSRDLVPFSIPRLRPWVDRAEFDRFFPGFEEGHFWHHDTDKQGLFNSGDRGAIALAHAKCGPKSPPWDPEIWEEDTDPSADMVDIRIRYTTPWSPVENMPDIMRDVLTKHGARMLLIWEEEDSNCGFDYVDPGRDIELSEDYGRELAIDGEEEDEDGEPIYGVNREALVDRVESEIDDDDMPIGF